MKSILKSCLSSSAYSTEYVDKNYNENDIVAELLGIVLKEKIDVCLSESEKKRLAIDNYQKELLSLAILSDDYNTNKLPNVGYEVCNIGNFLDMTSWTPSPLLPKDFTRVQYLFK